MSFKVCELNGRRSCWASDACCDNRGHDEMIALCNQQASVSYGNIHLQSAITWLRRRMTRGVQRSCQPSGMLSQNQRPPSGGS